MGGVTKPRKLALKFFHHGTAHKPGSSQSLLEDRGQFVLEFLMKAN
jgi:hypothetical protein